MEREDRELIAAVLRGDTQSFQPLVGKYSPRLFATARRYARRESEVEDIVQEVWLKAFSKLSSYRGDAPFEHWLMRMTLRTCYDFLRKHHRNKEFNFSELSAPETEWLDNFVREPEGKTEDAAAARELLARVLEQLPPPARMVITLLEIEELSLKEVAHWTGWSIPVVKVRAFRARALLRKALERLSKEKYM
jgi:RNA polymerase sigma-70 factor (ECF subfamily)